MKSVYSIASNIFLPLGKTTQQVFEKIGVQESSIQLIENEKLHSNPFYASVFTDNSFVLNGFTRFESACIFSMENALLNCKHILNEKTILILSTTKGNIELIENKREEDFLEKINLAQTAQKIACYFNLKQKPIVVSHACVSGVAAILLAKRILKTNEFQHAIIVGADMLSKFVVSGFHALHAVSPLPCMPFDAKRKGINLGEGASTLILSNQEKSTINVLEGATSNDANHISGPSRTGLELAFAIKKSMEKSGIQTTDLSFISAHGTGTIFNDEMESLAFENCKLSEISTQSLKGNFGHTLGASGVIESIIAIESLKNKIILGSKNFEEIGVSGKINVTAQNQPSSKKIALKSASGFGGCNAVILYSCT